MAKQFNEFGFGKFGSNTVRGVDVSWDREAATVVNVPDEVKNASRRPDGFAGPVVGELEVFASREGLQRIEAIRAKKRE
jgi:hypothetical protein